MAVDPDMEYPLATRPQTLSWSGNHAQLIIDPGNRMSVMCSSGI